MRKLIRITESDIHRMVKSTISRIVKEDSNNMTLQLIAQGIANMGTISARSGENDCEVELDNGELAVVMFDVMSNPYVMKGMRSGSYDVPDDPDEVVDDFDVEVTEIILEDESSIQDNGIVRRALMNAIEIDYSGNDLQDESEFYSDENYYGE